MNRIKRFVAIALMLLMGLTLAPAQKAQAAVATVSNVTVTSSNASAANAKAGDQVTIAFTASESLESPYAVINSQNLIPVAKDLGGSYLYTVIYTVQTADPSGSLEYSLFATDPDTNGVVKVYDRNMGGPTVMVDTFAPVVYPITLMASDPSMAEFVKSVPGDLGIVIVDNSQEAMVKTDWKYLKNNPDGTVSYMVDYRVTDDAGNVAQFAKLDSQNNLVVVPAYPLEVKLASDAEDPRAGADGLLPASQNLADSIEKGSVYQNRGVVVTLGSAPTNQDESQTSADDQPTMMTAAMWNFGSLDTSKVGDYQLGYKECADFSGTSCQKNEEGVDKSVKYDVRVVDTTATAPVISAKACGLSGAVQLSWTNPSDTDFDHVSIYRSTDPNNRGDYLNFVSAPNSQYYDSKVTNGITYFYTLVAFDGIGNASSPVVVSATPSAPTNVVLVSSSDLNSSGDQTVANDSSSKKEIKATLTSNQNSDQDNQDTGKTLPVFGFIILLILLGFGFYLLYQQRPEWFLWMAFWQKKTKPKKK